MPKCGIFYVQDQSTNSLVSLQEGMTWACLKGLHLTAFLADDVESTSCGFDFWLFPLPNLRNDSTYQLGFTYEQVTDSCKLSYSIGTKVNSDVINSPIN